jgi:hypothetical protein
VDQRLAGDGFRTSTIDGPLAQSARPPRLVIDKVTAFAVSAHAA